MAAILSFGASSEARRDDPQLRPQPVMSGMVAGAVSFEIVVLSSPQSHARRKRIAAMLDGMGIGNWRFFDVVPAEGLAVGHSEAESFRAYGSVLSAAELSCAASHIAIARRFLGDDRSSHVLVLEDDVFVDPMFDLSALVRFCAVAEIDYLKLYARFFVPARYITSVQRYLIYRATWPSLGTQAYILSKAGARRLVDHLGAVGLKYPIDVSMDRFWENKLPAVLFYPFPVMELSVPTTIHSAEHRKAVEDRNLTVASAAGGRRRPSPLVEKVSRKLGDWEMKAYDAALRARIRGRYDEINDLFTAKGT